ncbi:uncharacterized protein AAEQ78_006404 [Lycaon pictus]
MPPRRRAHTTGSDIRSKLHGFAVTNQPSRDCATGGGRRTPTPTSRPPRRTRSRSRVRRADLLRVPARSEPGPRTDAGSAAPAPARRARRGGSSPRGGRHRGEDGGAGRGPTPAGGRARSGSAPAAAEALTLAAAALADILSLSSAARGSSDPKLRATRPPAAHATDQINISRERAGLGAGAAAQARPPGRGLNSDKSPGSARPPRPGPLRGVRPAGASLRVRPLARPRRAPPARTQRPRPLTAGQPRGPPAAPQPARWPLRRRLPHLTSLEPGAGSGRNRPPEEEAPLYQSFLDFQQRLVRWFLSKPRRLSPTRKGGWKGGPSEHPTVVSFTW